MNCPDCGVPMPERTNSIERRVAIQKDREAFHETGSAQCQLNQAVELLRIYHEIIPVDLFCGGRMEIVAEVQAYLDKIDGKPDSEAQDAP